jgi:hypothetical protein
MLNHWGYLYLSIGRDLTHIETGLENNLRESGPTRGLRPNVFDPRGILADLLNEKCQVILRLSEPVHKDLVPFRRI